MSEILKNIPIPLLDDIINDRCIPIIGAGFSRNAILPKGEKMPLWNDLGKEIAEKIPDYTYFSAIDAISAYCHEYSRVKLIEELSSLLHIQAATPGSVHHAFAELQFNIVCTTNFDFLLESAYSQCKTQLYCRPILEENQLSMPQQKTERLLIKLHGDLNHPDRLVVTEEDYDNFLNRNPLMSTYLGNLLITRTPVFIGYSLDDPDFRQIWQIIGSRLGDMRRRAYAITVGIKPSDTARYERRGIKIVNISPNKDKYAETLEKFFVELHDYWLSKLIKVSTITDEASLQELSLSEKDPTRICLFLIPVNLQSFYKDKVFPIVQEVGLVPMLPEMMISPGDNSIAKINALINRSHIVVADLSSSILTEIGINFPEKKKLPKLLVIQEENIVSPLKIRGIEVILRPSELYDYPEKFLNDFQKLLQKFAEELMPQLSEEPLRLLNKKEYRAAVVSSISLVENTLRECLSKDDKCSSDLSKRPMPIRQMIDLALAQELIDHKDKAILIRGVYLRNELVHSTKPSKESTREFTKIVNDVMGIIDKTKSQKN